MTVPFRADPNSERRALTPAEVFPNSVPRNTEEGRALLQARLAQFGRIGTAIGFTFLALGSLAALGMNLEGGEQSVLAQLGSALVALCVWLIGRGRPRSEATLLSIDVLASWANCGLFIAMGFALPLFARPELIQLVAISQLLMLRAFLIPSSALRTACVHALPLSAVVASTYFLYHAQRPHPDAPDWPGYMAIAAILCTGALLVTTLTSKTIFGLRERALEAFQLGQYTLLEKIGEGGMGIVYKARHATLRRPTAIKLLPPERAGEHNLQRFEREVQLTSQLTHPNTIAIYDYGRSADGVLYYAMEYLDGLDLESLVAFDGPQPPARVAHVLGQVCGALEEAHAAGLIHRDIKPGNVLLCVRGGIPDVAKVVDFGLVKRLEGASGDSGLSAVNQIVGTPLFMAPEAIVRPNEVDARGDLYALGALGYYLLTGTPPFSGASVVEICGHHLHTAPEAPGKRLGKSLPEGLEQLVLACLAKSADERPQSAAELGQRLARCGVPPWERDQAASWWAQRRATIEALRSSTDGARASTLPMATLAVDLRARALGTPTPWHSIPGAPRR